MAPANSKELNRRQRVYQVLKFTKTSLVLLLLTLSTMGLVIIIEWRLFYDYFSVVGADWLLIGILATMSFFLMMGANLKKDVAIIIVGLVGGLLIESWGTQTELWRYFTEFPPYNDPLRPPWWIIPAWPISTLAINRMYLFLDAIILQSYDKLFRIGYWVSCLLFAFIFYSFSKQTWDLWFTRIFCLIVLLLLVCPRIDYRRSFLILVAGSTLGYFLEYWGTSTRTWIYYNEEVPPLVAVFAHGISSVGFSRVALFLNGIANDIYQRRTLRPTSITGRSHL